MIKNLSLKIFITILFANILFSCSNNKAENNGEVLTVSILPMKSVVQNIANKDININVMIPVGANHELYEPTPMQMMDLSKSNIFFTIGLFSFEHKWESKFQEMNSNLQIVPTYEGIEVISGHHHGDHDNSCSDSHADPHIWLSVRGVKAIAINVANTLMNENPDNAEEIEDNLNKYIAKADSVDNIVRSIFENSENKSFVIYHSALAYFAEDYDLTQLSLEQEGKEASPSNLQEIIKTAKQQGVKTVLISKEFNVEQAEIVAKEIKGKVVVFDPMHEDVLENIINIAKIIASN